MAGLAEGGADALWIETCQDLLQIKAALAAAGEVRRAFPGLLVGVSVTVEATGTLLCGASPEAVAAVLAPFRPDVLAVNCATGPAAMGPRLEALRRAWGGRIGCMPNAGLPILRNGKTHYPLEPAGFARETAALVRRLGLSVAGGCCGTTPRHICALREELARDGLPPPAARLGKTPAPAVSSLFSPVALEQVPRPFFIGERANATGSKKFREALLADDFDRAEEMLLAQENGVSHALDLSVAYAGRDEARDMETLVPRAARDCRLPLVIDATDVAVMETALKLYGGRAILNSTSFEHGEERAGKIFSLAAEHGAAVIALAIDEEGMARDVAKKAAIAERTIAFAAKYGLSPRDILFDALTFTIVSGDAGLRTAAAATLEAIRRIKRAHPDLLTVLGLSNVSFGASPPARKVLNAVFLARAVEAGLDACIINTANLLALPAVPEEMRRAAEALVDCAEDDEGPLTAFLSLFTGDAAKELLAGDGGAGSDLPAAEALEKALVGGRAAAAEEAVGRLLAEGMKAEDILNDVLVQGMARVGQLFNDGTLQLPFVLKSAETMKKAVDVLKPHFSAAAGGGETQKTFVIATVAGDIHDIGKNLVDIILSNNGYRVVNLGVKVGVEAMMEAVERENAAGLGMSGLLVRSVQTMKANLEAMEAAGMRVPVFLGGAALSRDYVERECAPVYGGKVFYCKDAFDTLRQLRAL
jgi:5-methyltetrahydrofolate--homocysteine methyltransferase